MRPSNKSRSRNKTGNNGGHNSNNNNQRRNSMGNIINRVFESAGPDGKVRGTPQQIIDKYQALARDAQVAGDRVAAESYLQHSEHYSRLLGEAQRAQQEARASQERDGDRDEGGFEPRRQQPSQPHMASGLTMIDTDDGFDSGPIETPEGRRSGSDDGGFSRRDREQRMNGVAHSNRPTAPHPAAEAPAPQPAPAEPAAAEQATPEPAPAAEPVAAASAPEPVPAEKPTAERPRRAAAGKAAREAAAAQAEPQAPEPQLEIELAEPQAEPVKKPRARRRKTQPADTTEEAAPAAQPEPAVSGE